MLLSSFFRRSVVSGLLLVVHAGAGGAQIASRTATTVSPRLLVESSVTFAPFDLGGSLDGQLWRLTLYNVSVSPALGVAGRANVSMEPNAWLTLHSPAGIINGNFLVRFTVRVPNPAVKPTVVISSATAPVTVLHQCEIPTTSPPASRHQCEANLLIADETPRPVVYPRLTMRVSGFMVLDSITMTRFVDIRAR